MEILGKPFLRTDQYTWRQDTKTFVIHCSDTKADQDIGVDEIRAWHIKERGWSDIGYHFVIRRNGTVWRGRPLTAIGAAVKGYNYETVSICLVGGDKADGSHETTGGFAAVQIEALEQLLHYLFEQYPTIPRDDDAVKGHRQFPLPPEDAGKTCPNFAVEDWWPVNRERILA